MKSFLPQLDLLLRCPERIRSLTPMQPTLLILAAGMGSRYGGLKQLDAMGPSGQTMLDYAVEDAIRAGFGKVVFVIRKDFEDAFREQVGERYSTRIQVEYAFQQLDDLPEGFQVPTERTKPWGTGHAVRAARHCIAEPFAVINADDFYGREAYATIAQHLSLLTDLDKLELCMVGYPLQNTLSPHGSVNRGICEIDQGQLVGVEEYTGICVDADGRLRGNALDQTRKPLAADCLVSMNFWGFTPALFTHLEAAFIDFLTAEIETPKSEFYIPSLIDQLVKDGVAPCPVLTADSPWFGVTYPEDKARVVADIKKLTDAGLYQA